MKAEKRRRIHWLRRNAHWVLLVLFVPLALLVFAWGREIVDLRHVHGLAYSPDGSRLLIPDHFGISAYIDGRWSKLPGPAHDYMGFAVARELIFTSGHAAGSRGGANPLGLISSRDGGRSWTALDFAGQADFHLMAAGYASNALYVYNAAPNALMPRAGIYQLEPDGLASWRSARGIGLDGQPRKLAVHPVQTATIAVATTAGLFLSQDGGDSFKPIAADMRATALLFMLEGDSLLVATHDDKSALFRIAIADGVREELSLPPAARDPVVQLAQNPVRREELALASSARAVYISGDAGKSWRGIARGRKTLPGL